MKLTLLIISIILIILIIAVLLIKITIKLEWQNQLEKSYFLFNIHLLYGLIHFQKKVVFQAKPESLSFGFQNQSNLPNDLNKKERFSLREILNQIERFWRLLKNSRQLYKIIYTFCQRITITELRLESYLGTGDAAKTATLIGKAWTIVGMTASLIQSIFRVQTIPKIEIYPLFYEKKEEFAVECIFNFRIGHLIWAGIKFIWSWQGEKYFFIFPALKKQKPTT